MTTLEVYLNEIDRQSQILRSTFMRRYHENDNCIVNILTELDTFVEFARNEVKKLTAGKPEIQSKRKI